MLFSIIYEYECPMHRSIRSCSPPKSLMRHLAMTECSDGEPSDWCSDLWGGKVKHRKVAGILSKKDFKEFLCHTGLFPEDIETMGSLGAPGCGYGIAPAISFRDDVPEAIKSAYVTPLCAKPSGEPIRKTGATERDFRRVRSAILNNWS